jgi:DNA-binding response OmpR family regulator
MRNIATAQRKAVKKALVIEDDGEMGLLLNILLDEKQWELDYVRDLLSAVDYLDKEEPSFVILDNKLPDGFGVDFISYLKNKYPAIKIIMISGFGSVRDVALENGADVFLEKPFSKRSLYESITEVVH